MALMIYPLRAALGTEAASRGLMVVREFIETAACGTFLHRIQSPGPEPVGDGHGANMAPLGPPVKLPMLTTIVKCTQHPSAARRRSNSEASR